MILGPVEVKISSITKSALILLGSVLPCYLHEENHGVILNRKVAEGEVNRSVGLT